MIKARTIATAAILLIVTVASGAIHGKFTNRWGVAPDMAAAGESLAKLPKEFGDWTMVEERALPEAAQEVLQCAGSVSRSYANQKTGEVVNMFLLVGPPGPTAVHTPDVCYSSQDYAQERPRESVQVQGADGGRRGNFWVLTLRPNNLEASRLRSYYAWSDGDEWQASENPRLTSGSKSMLYKLQLAAPAAPTSDPAAPDAGKRFLQAFLAKGVWPIQPQD